jgi:hypothetical protein
MAVLPPLPTDYKSAGALRRMRPLPPLSPIWVQKNKHKNKIAYEKVFSFGH